MKKTMLNINQLVNVINLYEKAKSNPTAFVKELISTNANCKNAYARFQQSGLSINDYLKQFSKENNIDLNNIIHLLYK